MDLQNYKPVNKDLSEKYLIKLFKKYSINDTLEDSKILFKLIQEACETLTIPPKEILNNVNLNIVGKGGFGLNSYDNLTYSVKDITDAESAIVFFAKIILENESRSISNYEVFDIRERLEYLEKQVHKLTNSNSFR